MAGYYIASYDIADPQGFQAYVPQVMPLLQKHRAEILVADTAPKTLEGEPRMMHVVLRVATDADARAFCGDPAYAPVRKIRIDATRNGQAVLSRGFVPPGS